ncbi:MAG: hypothetical protein F4Y00_07745 [Bacteroidetes bacterium SB0662_bin_6]|nr:hypothetical protein [Gammaproteobacteria bacterium]MYE04847.1 hypothetical protein [Bacteroidetes bacterium SB0662_bin_6]
MVSANKNLQNLVSAGQLHLEAPDADDIRHYLQRGDRYLAKARTAASDGNNDDLFDYLYVAAFAYSWGALCLAGYRARDRYLAFQCLAYTTDIPREDWVFLSKLHNTRNDLEYGSRGKPHMALSSLPSDWPTRFLQITERLNTDVYRIVSTAMSSVFEGDDERGAVAYKPKGATPS